MVLNDKNYDILKKDLREGKLTYRYAVSRICAYSRAGLINLEQEEALLISAEEILNKKDSLTTL